MQPDHFPENYRERIVYWIACMATCMVLPFTIFNFMQQRWLLAATSLSILVILACNALWLHWGRKPPISIGWLAPMVSVFLAMAFFKQGVIAAFWSYPAITMFYFVLPQHQAKRVNLMILAVVAPAAAMTLPGSLVARLVATLVATSLCSGIFVHLISIQQASLREQAMVDPLTKVLNRVQLDLLLCKARAHFRRSRTSFCLVAIDVDHFKSINDDWGHAVGDDVLRGVAKVLKDRLRASDTIFRIGGEEFLVLLDNADLESGLRVAESLRHLIASAKLIADRTVTVSIGVAQLREGDELKDWLKRADDCLYRAKAAGRNQVMALRPRPA